MEFIKLILKTDVHDYAATISRLMLAIVFFPHGAQKLFGWFGGHGFWQTMDVFTSQMGIPSVFAFLAIMAESIGSALLFFGLFSRIAALGIAVNMIVAVLMFHLPNGFFMNWFGNQKGEGFEYHLLAIAVAMAVIIRGGGAVSVDSEIR